MAQLIAVIVVSIIIFIVVVVIWGVMAHRRRISAGREDMIGRTAEVVEGLKPKGMVLVEGERWTAICEKGSVKRGEEVIITKVDGLKLYVTKKE